MGLAFPKEEIRALVAALSGVAASRVYWGGEPEHHIGPISGKAGKIVLNVVAIAENGGIEPRRYDEDGTQKTEWGHNETVTISARADAFKGHGEAFDVLQNVRFRLKLPSSKKTLRAAGVVFVDAPSIVPLDSSVDTREGNAASLDFRVARVPSEVPEVDGDEGVIEKVISGDAPDPPSDAPAYGLVFTRTD